MYFIISTHTSRVGCDDLDEFDKDHNKISTHTSRVGCDHSTLKFSCYTNRFLLTHPVWDVTYEIQKDSENKKFLLTHPVWDVTIVCRTNIIKSIFLLTHPVWDVTYEIQKDSENKKFLLTHPVWDVTK